MRHDIRNSVKGIEKVCHVLVRKHTSMAVQTWHVLQKAVKKDETAKPCLVTSPLPNQTTSPFNTLYLEIMFRCDSLAVE